MIDTQLSPRAHKALTELQAMAAIHGWTVWAAHEAGSGWMDGKTELEAVVEVSPGKILRIKGGTYSDPSVPGGWMYALSAGWGNLESLPEVRNFGRFRYQVAGDTSELFESVEELCSRHDRRGTYSNPGTRRELQGQPLLVSFLGPMFGGYDKDGIPVIRYESREEYASNFD